LKILEPIRVSGEVEINEQDLNNSIASTILINAFADLLIFSLENNGVVNAREIISQQRFNWKNVLLNQGYFCLLGHRETGAEVIFSADITLEDARTLGISPRQWQGLAPDLSIDLQPFTVDLGKDVEIKSFILDDQTLFCQGSFLILP
ncbi:MAG: LmeA family phospholipid-binding protein, partial [Microcystis sp. M53600_WE12]|nr:LmeA family phospholipid-binding protein [Microcystis sp. M53600_WE12]